MGYKQERNWLQVGPASIQEAYLDEDNDVNRINLKAHL